MLTDFLMFLFLFLLFYVLISNSQVDVIESQWNVLQSHIQNSHDFMELVGFHQEYVWCLFFYSKLLLICG